ncbi:alpha/beta fold hydrolase [Nocardioides mangrovicus]|uniref:Alpha/beta fold hydrolase n=1 Tax=Nocardioides mangrovicus TaxID=2478913 RepID=A0A3L8NWH3_9ACTN|nr:alpha/beta fold hydrolase [Nocardioides mangrovicus]RLV47596.1 alpha/beta fold hydrolase [Nocardioides mangrovicus]
MPTLTTYDGLRLAVACYGPADATLTVLLAHCWTCDQDLWRYQVRDLLAQEPGRVRIVTWDHRGHGLSDPTPRGTTTIENLARDMSDVVDTFAPDGRLVLAGHSIGGMTLMALARLRPELYASRVAGALFCSTSSGGLDADCMVHERTDALAALAGVPTEVLVGTHDRLTPVRMARRIADAVPDSRLTLLPDAGHMLPLERDDVVSATLLRLVRQAG